MPRNRAQTRQRLVADLHLRVAEHTRVVGVAAGAVADGKAAIRVPMHFGLKVKGRAL